MIRDLELGRRVDKYVLPCKWEKEIKLTDVM